jgi:transposase-like protein
MPWKETSVMDERMRFIGRLLPGEKMARLCREFGISRVTGHKIWKRYQENVAVAIQNRSRAQHLSLSRKSVLCPPTVIEQLLNLVCQPFPHV